MIATVEEAWACHEALRKLGFESKDIFLSIVEDRVQMILRYKNLQVFGVPVGTLPADKRGAFLNDWGAFCKRANAADRFDPDLVRIYENSNVVAHATELVSRLVEAGVWSGKAIWPPPGVYE